MQSVLLPILFLTTFFYSFSLEAQKLTDEKIVSLIKKYQEDPRGPYKEIRWFCDDGTIIPPKESCPDGGVQRASYKESTENLAKSNHLFFGQILATTSKEDFWDADYNYSRLKQYQLERYLQKVDDGWVNRKSQFYRGAYQVEDETKWGNDFLKWVLRKDKNLQSNFFLIRQAAKDIPHYADTDLSQRIRALSKVVAEEYSAFMDLRIKIHGQPDMSDIKSVKAFQEKHEAKLAKTQKEQIENLIADMETFYAPTDINKLNKQLNAISSKSKIHSSIKKYMEDFENAIDVPKKIMLTSEALLNIRQNILEEKSSKTRLALLDLSNELESIYFKSINEWDPETIEGMAQKIEAAGKAAAGTGFIELWEWKSIAPQLAKVPATGNVDASKTYLSNARRLVEWGAGMTRAVYDDVVELYRPFEPKAGGFIDDRVRSSVLLDLGTTVGALGEMIAKNQDSSNYLLGLKNASHARGLNPGFALGSLVILETTREDMEVDKNKIYVFNRPPSDLKPVAGIATVTEGNLVSHVQLLARNLSIPNAVISDQNLKSLKAFAGKKVFYAVASSGRVIIKDANKMNAAEKALFAKKERNQGKVNVPIDKIDLAQTSVINMRAVNAASSGVLCGPKAANLGQLKDMYPEQVVEGLVIPFGIFRQHMDQPMNGQKGSYWQFLKSSFAKAAVKREEGSSEEAIEKYLLKQLEILREGIHDIEFTEDFTKDLYQQFDEVFGKKIGRVPVFLRSDTNMEDLKDFTGAGLNLTLFNVVDKDEIMNGIKKVWASPYTERSFKWRQRYLLNPENVFPSILIIPSVDVDFSGVLITKGITSNEADDLTLAISRGAGGAVDGQAAESYLLSANGMNQLLTPAREPGYRRLPVRGGTSKNTATFERSIASKNNINTIRDFAKTIEETFPKSEDGAQVAAYDIEFGFADDKLWLFQIRPFVESKNDWENAGVEDNENNTVSADESEAAQSSWSWWVLGLSVALIAASAIGFFIKKKQPNNNQNTNS